MAQENLPLPIQDDVNNNIGNLTGLLAAVSGIIEQINTGPNLTLTTTTLDTVQNIGTNSMPRFAGLSVGLSTGLAYMTVGAISTLTLGPALSASGSILNITTGDNLVISAGALNTTQDLRTSASPTFTGLTLGIGPGALAGVLSAVDGVVSQVSLGPSLVYSGAYNTLDATQDLRTTAQPTFRGLTIGNSTGLTFLTAGVLSTLSLGAGLTVVGDVLNATGGGVITITNNLRYTGGDLDTVQPIQTTSSPTFAGLTLGTLAGVLYGAAGVISAVTLGSSLTFSAGTLNTTQDLQTSASPTFAGLTLGIGPGALVGVLSAVDGAVSQVSLGPSLVYSGAYNTLDTTQDLRTTSAPTFAGLTIGTLTVGTLAGVLCGSAGVISQVTLGSSLTFSAGTLNTTQDLRTSSAPTFAGLTLGTLAGVLYGAAGVISAVTLGSSLTFSAGTLNTTQDLRTSASPTFASLTVSALTVGTLSGVLYGSAGVVSQVTLGSNLNISTGALNLASSVSVGALTVGTGSGVAWLSSGVVSAKSLSANLYYDGSTVDLSPFVSLSGLRIGSLNGILSGSSGVVSALTLGSNLSIVSNVLSVASSVSFTSLSITGLNGLVYASAGALSSVVLDANLTLSGNTLSLNAQPTFTNVSLSSLTDGIVFVSSHLLSSVSIGSNLTLSAGVLNVVASPTFSGLTIGNSTAILYSSAGIISNLTLDANLTLSSGTLALSNSITLEQLTLGIGPGALVGVLSAVDGAVSQVSLGPSLVYSGAYNTLDTTQDLRTTSAPTFAGLTLGTLAGLLYGAAGVVSAVTIGTGLDFSAGTLSLQSTPTFTGLTIGTLSGLLYGAAGVVSQVIIGSGLNFSAGTLSLQSALTVSTLTISTLSGLLCGAAGVISAVTLGSGLTFSAGTLSLQSAPTFSGLTIGTLSGLLCGAAGVVSTATIGTGLNFSAGTLSLQSALTVSTLTIDNINGILIATSGAVSAVTLGSNITLTGSTLNVTEPPNFSGLTLGIGAGAFGGILGAISGVVSPVNLGTSLTFNSTYNTLDVVQDIRSTASVTFAGLTLSGLANGVLKSSSGVISGGATTNDLPEGSNLYFTDTRVNAAFTLAGDVGQIQVISSGTNPTNYLLGLPQPLSRADWPEFAGVQVDNIASKLVGTDSSGNLLGVILTGGLTYTANGGAINLKNSGIYSITGTSNQVNVSTVANVATLTLPQAIASISTPTFANLTISGLTASQLVYSNASNQLSSITLSANLTLTSNTLSTVQNIQTTSTVRFASINDSSRGSNNQIFGANALLSSSSINCTAIGTNALYNNTGYDNVAIGITSGYANTTGNYGVFIGSAAGANVTTGSNGVYIGANSNSATGENDNEIVIGATTGNGANTATIAASSGLYVSGLTLSGLTASRLVYSNASKQLSSVTLGANLTLTSDTLNTVQNIQTSSSVTFAGLTLSGLLSTMLKTNGSGAVVAASAGTDYQAVMSAGTNITITSNTIATSSSVTFAGLTLSGLLSTMLKTNGSGVVAAAVAGTDYQAVMSAGTNITITSNTIATSATPAFAAILCTTIGTQNTICGTNAGANLTAGTGSNALYGFNAGAAVTSGGANVAIGPLALSAGSALTAAAGNNIGVGPSALLNVSGSAASNIGIGASAGSTITTGTGNFYAGQAAAASSATVNYEGVISVGSSGATGKGTNTMFINAPAGVYFTLPILAQFPIINSTVTVSTIAGYTPYYSYQGSSNGAVTYFNRGITLTTTSASGGYWRFAVPGLYRITANMNIFTSGSSTTFIGSIITPGATSGIVNNGVKFWASVGASNTGWTLTTLINVSDISLYYFLSEYSGIGINSTMNGCASLLIEMISIN